MKYFLWVLGALVLLTLVYFFFFRSAAVTNYPPHEGPIVAFGDSLVAGTGASEGKALPALLAARIGEPVENFGVPGDTTAKALVRIDTVLVHNPRIAIVLLGGNDYLQRIPKTDTFKNLATIIDHFQADGAVVVLVGVRGGVLVDNFAGEYRKLAKAKGAVYVPDVLDGLLGDKKYMADQVHPNDTGYARIAERVAEALQPILK